MCGKNCAHGRAGIALPGDMTSAQLRKAFNAQGRYRAGDFSQNDAYNLAHFGATIAQAAYVRGICMDAFGFLAKTSECSFEAVARVHAGGSYANG